MENRRFRREKCERNAPYLKPSFNLLHSLFLSHTKFYLFLYSVRMRENADQKNSKYGHFWHIVSSVLTSSFVQNYTVCHMTFFTVM